jgi:hypothetical protein
MRKRWITWLLLAAIVLSLIGCAKPDALAGTWNMVSSMRHKEREEEIKNGTYAASYTFDGHGKGTRTVLSNGKTTTGSFRYELIERGTTILVIDNVQIPYSITDDSLMMQVPEGGGNKDFLAFVRE